MSFHHDQWKKNTQESLEGEWGALRIGSRKKLGTVRYQPWENTGLTPRGA